MQPDNPAQEAVAFGKVRSYVWPIHRHELKKLLPMFIMLFFVCFNYTILRNLKDALVLTKEHSGAEVIPFIKVWGILPAAIICTMIFSYLSNHFSRKKVFYIIISTFISYYFLFAFFIYPIQDHLQADWLANFFQSFLPVGFKGFIAMLRNWPLTIFYIMAELWSTMVLMVLFWGFANEITKISEARRFYSVLSIGSNTASIIAGQVAVLLSSQMFSSSLFFGQDKWEQTLCKLTILVVLSGVGILLAFRWMTKNVLSDPKNIPEETQRLKKKEKKMSFRESISYIAKSKYLLCIAVLVVSYNLVIHMVEVIWKDQLSQLYPNPQDIHDYLNNLTSIMGIISTTTSLLLAGIIKRLGWTRTALITPFVLLITTIGFFTCFLTPTLISPIAITLLGVTPLTLTVFLGSFQNCFTKAAKYSLFDITKDMAFIPLTPEHKLKGKASIDGIGSRLGKSGGSFIYQWLLVVFGS